METQKGFLITPTMQGKQVQITIKRFDSSQDNANTQEINQRQTETTTRIPLNTWVKLSQSADNNASEQDNSITYEASQNFASRSTIYIKITKISSP